MGTYAPQDYLIYLIILLFIYYFSIKFLFVKVKLDKKFLKASLPFIPLGVFIRVLADTSFFEANQWWSITPGVYLVVIALLLTSLFLGFKLKKEEYWIIPFLVGVSGSFILLYYLSSYFIHPMRLFYPFLLSLSITSLVYIFFKWFRREIFQKFENLSIIFAHLLDGSATFIAYNFYGFGEEHLLPLYLINLAGNNALIIIPIKLLLVLGVLYLIEKYAEAKERNLLKFLIFILGIGPGLRDALLPSLAL